MRSEKVAEMVKNERATEKQIERFAFLLQKATRCWSFCEPFYAFCNAAAPQALPRQPSPRPHSTLQYRIAHALTQFFIPTQHFRT